MDNMDRNHMRNMCRSALEQDYAAVTNPNPPNRAGDPNPYWWRECGFGGFPVRSWHIPPLPGDLMAVQKAEVGYNNKSLSSLAIDFALNGPLTWALGSCGEYSRHTKHMMPVPGFTEAPVFVRLTNATRLCGGAGTAGAFWCDLFGVLVILGYLVYLRYHCRTVAIKEDRSMWTTGDYAVLVRGLANGLDDAVPADERLTAGAITTKIFADLKKLGFGRGQIKQIEVGRKCRKEVKLMHKLERANIERHEIAARAFAASERKRKRKLLMERMPMGERAKKEEKEDAKDDEKEEKDLEDDREELNEKLSKIMTGIDELYARLQPPLSHSAAARTLRTARVPSLLTVWRVYCGVCTLWRVHGV